MDSKTQYTLFPYFCFPNRQKKQRDGEYLCVYRIAFRMSIQQKLTPPVLFFSIFPYDFLASSYNINADLYLPFQLAKIFFS